MKTDVRNEEVDFKKIVHLLINLVLGFMFLIWLNNAQNLKAQDLHFSQFFAIPLILGPSFAGDGDGTRINAVYRNQWPQIYTGFVSYGFSIDHDLRELKSGIGLQVMRDQRGEVGLNNTNMVLHYSYDIALNGKKLHFRPGLSFAYIVSGVDYSKLRLRDQIVLETPVPGSRPDYVPHNYPDAALSLLFYNKRYWAGTKIDHLMRPPQSIGSSTRIPIHVSVYGGMNLSFKDRFSSINDDQLKLAFNILSTSYFYQVDVGIVALKKNIEIGGWYRGVPAGKEYSGSDALIVSLGYIFDSFRIGYSHDFTISGLNTLSNGADEICITYIFNQNREDKSRKKAVRCVRGFIK